MASALRVILATVTAIGSFYFSLWTLGSLLFLAGAGWLAPVLAAAIAIAATRFVWTRASVSGGLARAIGHGALVTGAIGFSVGFFGPILLTPGANQGPLLGIFITGPLGFLLGGIGGAVCWRVHRPDGS